MEKPWVVLLKSQLSLFGGAEKYAWRIAEAFKKKQPGGTVTLLTTGEVAPKEGFEVISRKATSKVSFYKLLQYDRFCSHYLASHQPDIIFGLDRNRFQTHLRASNGVHAAYLQHRKESDPFLKQLTFSLNPLHRTLLKLEKIAFEHPRLQTLFTNSLMVKNELLTFYKIDPGKIHVVHNGVEWTEKQEDFSRWEEKRGQIATSLNLDPHPFHFLFLGHNYRRKGLLPLLTALSLLPHRDFHLSVVGKEKDISFFKRYVQRLNLSAQVTFFGPRSDIASFYQLADALVIPSFYDPFANVTVEALAMGVYVVSSKTNGGHEVLTEETGCVIGALSSPDSVAQALLCALKHPKTKERADRIRQSVKYLDFSTQLEKMISLCL